MGVFVLKLFERSLLGILWLCLPMPNPGDWEVYFDCFNILSVVCW